VRRVTSVMMSLAVFTAVLSGPAQAQADAPNPEENWVSMSTSDGVELRYVPLAVTFEDYPRDARRADVEGTSIVRLKVDPSGRLLDCTTARSSGWPSLDERACQLYRTRGRFQLRGTTQPITVAAPVEWRLID